MVIIYFKSECVKKGKASSYACAQVSLSYLVNKSLVQFFFRFWYSFFPISVFALASDTVCVATWQNIEYTWWRHQMETFSALLAICAGNSPVTGEFPAQRLVTRSFDGFFVLRLNKRLSKQSWGWWFEMPSRPLWRHCNEQCWCSIGQSLNSQETPHIPLLRASYASIMSILEAIKPAIRAPYFHVVSSFSLTQNKRN